MSDYERTIELVETAQDSAGRSSQQFAKYADSVEYSVKRLSNTWEQFRVNLANNDFYKNLIDNLNTLLEKISTFDAWDWTKLLTVFFTIGQSSIKSFLSGAQKAISDITPSIQKGLTKTLPTKIEDFNFVQKAIFKPSQRKIDNRINELATKEQEEYNKQLALTNSELSSLEKQREEYTKTDFANLTKEENEALAQQASVRVKNIANLKETEARLKVEQQTAKDTASERFREQATVDTMTNPAVLTAQMQTIGAAAGAAFTAAFTTSMMTDDPGTILKTTLVSGATAAIPGIINTFNAELASSGKISSALGTSLSGGLKTAAIVAAIALLAAGLKFASNKWHEHNEEVLEAENGYYRTAKRLEELKEKEEELGKKSYEAAAQAEKSSKSYSELANKVDELEKLRGKILLTSEESERLVEVSNEIADIAPELVSQYDAEGNAVIILSDAYKELIQQKKEAMLIDQLAAAETARDSAKNALEIALDNRQSAEELYNQTHGKNGELEKNLQFFVNNPYWAGNDLNDILENVYVGLMGDSWKYIQGLEYSSEFVSLTPEEEKELGAELKKITEGNSFFDFLQSWDDEDVVDKYRSYYQDLPLEEQIKLQEKLNEAIKDVSNNYTQLDFAVQGAIDAYVEANKQIISVKLQQDSAFYNKQEDKNVQDMMQRYILQTSGLSEESLRKEFEATGHKKTDYDYNTEFSKFLEEKLENITIDETDLKNTFTQSVIDVLSQLNELELDLPQLSQYLQKVLGEDLFNIWVEQHQIEIETYNKQLRAISNIVGTQVDYSKGPVGVSSDAMVNKLMEARYIDDFIEKFNTWNSIDRKDDFLKMFKDIDAEDIVKIFNVKWDEVAVAEYAATIDALAKEANADRNKIEGIVKALNLFDYIPANIDDFKDQIDERFKAYDKYDKKIKALQTAGDSWAKDGKVSAAGIEAIYDAGFKVADLVDNNLQFNTEKAKEIIKEEIKGEKEAIEIQKTKIKLALDALKAIQSYTGAYTAKQLTDLEVSPDDIEKYFYKDESGRYRQRKTIVNAEVKNYQEIIENEDKELLALITRLDTLDSEFDSVYEGWGKEIEENTKKIEDAQKAVEDAYENVLEKQQAVIDKQEELNKVFYGNENHKNKLDELYNYNTAIETIEDSISDAKEALDDLDGKDPTEFLDAWISGTHQKAANVQAANDRYAAAIDSINSMLTNRLTDYLTSLGRGISTNVSDYYNYNPELDRYEINYQQLNAAQMNDDLKDFIEEQIDLMNQHKKAIKKNQDDLKKLEKEFEDYQKKIRDDYISVQESIAKTLEEFYKKEIEDKKEMYDALKEADDKYLDALEKAIERERKLRDRQDKWNSLATKEKKLSLLQRDTSGANQKQVQSLQKEVEKERQSMLDNAVDTIVDNLKELYEEQQETREIELEYQEVLQENTDYIAEANSLLQSWKTVDEMREWMWGHTKDIDKMSDEAVEKLTEDWSDMFDTIQTYNAMTATEFSNAFDISGQEVQRIVLDTSETLTSEADRAFGEITTQVNTAIESAEKAVADAMDALAKAQQTYNEKIADLNDLIDELGGKIEGIDYNPSEGGTGTYDFSSGLTGMAGEAFRDSEFYEPGNMKPIETIIEAAQKQEEIKKRYPEQVKELEQNGMIILTLPNKLDPDTKDSWAEAGFLVARPNTPSQYRYVFNTKDDYWNWVREEEYTRANWKLFKKGGLANYTGPAWVDGTPSRPEAFLNAEDTARIGEAANIFASVASLSTNGSLSSGLSQSIGDTNVQLNIHVDSIATPEQVDYLIDRVKEEFVNTANPIGTAVILHQ